MQVMCVRVAAALEQVRGREIVARFRAQTGRPHRIRKRVIWRGEHIKPAAHGDEFLLFASLAPKSGVLPPTK